MVCGPATVGPLVVVVPAADPTHMPHHVQVATFAEASYSSQWGFAPPSFASKTTLALQAIADDRRSPGPGEYEAPAGCFTAARSRSLRPMPTSSFATRSKRGIYMAGHAERQCVANRPATGIVGPGHYRPMHGHFDQYEDLRTSTAPGPRMHVGKTRFSSGIPRFAPLAMPPGLGDHSPAPGAYDLKEPGTFDAARHKKRNATARAAALQPTTYPPPPSAHRSDRAADMVAMSPGADG